MKSLNNLKGTPIFLSDLKEGKIKDILKERIIEKKPFLKEEVETDQSIIVGELYGARQMKAIRQIQKKVGTLKTKKENMKKCCICGKEYAGYGHNAQPLQDGRCCDKCNKKVIVARIKNLTQDYNVQI